MPEEYIIVQVLQAVPAKRVLAALAHHLRAAFAALDVDSADWTLLDGGFCVRPNQGPMLWHSRLTVFTGRALVPSILAA